MSEFKAGDMVRLSDDLPLHGLSGAILLAGARGVVELVQDALVAVRYTRCSLGKNITIWTPSEVIEPTSENSKTGEQLLDRLNAEAARMSKVVDGASDGELLGRALRHVVAHRGRGRIPREVVARVFGLGSTYSAALCQRFELDPYEVKK